MVDKSVGKIHVITSYHVTHSLPHVILSDCNIYTAIYGILLLLIREKKNVFIDLENKDDFTHIMLFVCFVFLTITIFTTVNIIFYNILLRTAILKEPIHNLRCAMCSGPFRESRP